MKQVLAAEGLAADDDALQLIARSADGGMRDGLSILDQVLSFGEGPVTAGRVREVLGLIPDDVYGEMLRIVTERDVQAVFPLVDRLMEAGADLSEFVGGGGDTLRALLVAGVGGQPEGLTEDMQALVRQAAARVPPADVVRLLAVLAEAESQVRQAGNPRLVVELLVLRWATMDRTVALEEVIRALGAAEPVGGPPPRSPAAPPRLRDSAPAPVARPEAGPLTLERLRSLWPQIVADARAKSPLLGALLADTEVAGLEGATVAVRLLDNNAVHAEGIERQREALGQLVARYVPGPVRIRLAEVAGGNPRGGGGGGGGSARPARLTHDVVQAERLKMLRARDPTLNAAVDALDLELLE